MPHTYAHTQPSKLLDLSMSCWRLAVRRSADFAPLAAVANAPGPGAVRARELVRHSVLSNWWRGAGVATCGEPPARVKVAGPKVHGTLQGWGAGGYRGAVGRDSRPARGFEQLPDGTTSVGQGGGCLAVSAWTRQAASALPRAFTDSGAG